MLHYRDMFRIALGLFLLLTSLQSATLTFEGLRDGLVVGAFYSDVGIQFTGAVASVDADAGGTGEFGS